MRVPLHKGNRFAYEYPAYLPVEALKWLRIIRDHRIEVINPYFPHLHQLTVALLAATGLFKGRFISTFQGSDVRITLASTGLERTLIRWILHENHAIVPCSAGLAEELSVFDETLRPSLFPILNGVSAADFLARRDPGFEPATVLPRSRRIILNVASYQYRKGHDLLLRAFQQVHRQFPDAYLVIVGAKGPDFDTTVALATGLGLRDHVAFAVDEPYNRIPAYMANAEIFAMTSRWIKGKMGEGLPLSLLEAGAAGMPVVSTRSTGVDEIVTDGLDGWLVPVEDANALAASLIDAMSRPEEARARAERLRRRVSAEFSWASRWQLYRTLCER